MIRSTNKPQEKTIALYLADYLKLKKYIYRFDLAADLILTQGQKAKHKRLQMSKRGYPDLFLAEPVNQYHGLYVELKKDKSEVFLKNGITYKKSIKKVKNSKGVVIETYDHIQEQLKMHQLLKSKGYCVLWGFGLSDTINKIEKYIKGELNENFI